MSLLIRCQVGNIDLKSQFIKYLHHGFILFLHLLCICSYCQVMRIDKRPKLRCYIASRHVKCVSSDLNNVIAKLRAVDNIQTSICVINAEIFIINLKLISKFGFKCYLNKRSPTIGL